MSKPSEVGFAVIYRWRLRAGMEEPFRQGWERVTLRMARERGALGSRLHQAEDGTWVAYARWPDRASWEKARSLPPVDAEGIRLMNEAMEESFPPILLRPIAEH